MKAWWFENHNRARVGLIQREAPPLELCKHGLHASERALDAMPYANHNARLCRVEVFGATVIGHDKLCAEERRVLKMTRLTNAEIFYRFLHIEAIRCLSDWDVPKIVTRYLRNPKRESREDVHAACRNAYPGYATTVLDPILAKAHHGWVLAYEATGSTWGEAPHILRNDLTAVDRYETMVEGLIR